MMTNEVSLKPCPFCGSTDLSLQRKTDPSPPSYPDGVCVIECWGCGALGPFCIEDQNAAKAWNDRGVVEPPATRCNHPPDAQDLTSCRICGATTATNL